MNRFASRLASLRIGLTLVGIIGLPGLALAFAKPSAIGVPEFDASGAVAVVALIACLVAIAYLRARWKQPR